MSMGRIKKTFFNWKTFHLLLGTWKPGGYIKTSSSKSSFKKKFFTSNWYNGNLCVAASIVLQLSRSGLGSAGLGSDRPDWIGIGRGWSRFWVGIGISEGSDDPCVGSPDRPIRWSNIWIGRSWDGSANPESDRPGSADPESDRFGSTVRTNTRPRKPISHFCSPPSLMHRFPWFFFLINHILTPLSFVLNKFLISKICFVADLSGLKEEILRLLHKTKKCMIFLLKSSF